MSFFAGYVGSKSFLEKVADIIKDLRKCNPDLTYGKVQILAPQAHPKGGLGGSEPPPLPLRFWEFKKNQKST